METGIHRLRRLYWSSTAAMLLVGSLGLAAVAVWELSLADRGSAIDEAGLQRSRALRLAMQTLQVRDGSLDSTALGTTARDLEAEQEALLDPAQDLPADALARLEAAAEPLDEAVRAARCVAATDCDETASAVERVGVLTQEYFQRQDAVVKALREAQRRDRAHARLIALVFALGCGLLVLVQALFLVSPAMARAIENHHDLEESQRRTEQHAEELDAQAAQLAHALEEAQAATRLRTRFVANVSHEIRTPMNGVLGMTELLLDTSLDADQRQLAQTAQRSAEALLTVVNDILDFSKLEAGKHELVETSFDPTLLAKEVARTFFVAARDKGLTLLEQVEADVPAQVRGDAGRLRQVLSNLVSNAIKFTSEGSVRIGLRVEGEIAVNENATLQFSVHDSGTGISPEGIERLFQPFAQVDGSNARVAGGTGLGLTISKQLAERMGGHLTVESELGRGSVFTATVVVVCEETAAAGRETAGETCREISLLGDEADQGSEAGEAGSGPEPSKSGVYGPVRVLLVEDNAVNQLVARRFLERAGIEVDVAENGAEALEQLAGDTSYRLIFMDCQMPVMDGFEATRRIRALPSPVGALPIVALTASALVGEQQDCRDAGMSDFLAKPLRQDALEKVLKRFLGDAVGVTALAAAS